MPAFVDLTGDTYGNLVMLEVVGRSGGHATWRVRCTACGEQKVVLSNNVRSGGTRSCGKPACSVRRTRS